MKNKLIPGEALIYESTNGVIYARYRDPPHNNIPRWEVGRTSTCALLSYKDFLHMQELARSNTGFSNAWETMLVQYYLIKDIDTKET